ncbi:putative arrestin-like protein [Zalerion maritima]|uniref:Arrestin-like protein n=1 Tax=Zalerion maritima TaxID=339359 RepID=A0AAD5WSW4_9PEZI|nr:putative arrestin-like protein [Zalerion maritima]
MSVRISLDNPPEFYTNLDLVTGRIILSLNRPEQVSGIVVKLEGESNTALAMPLNSPPGAYPATKTGPGEALSEAHKILYKVQQVFPEQTNPYGPTALPLQPGQHQFPFKFKMPMNNICGNPQDMARLGGVVGMGGFGSGGVRVMDGSKQLMYKHVLRTLPPSLTGFPREAEIRYYIKVTIQRPGLFKENWRFQQGLKFLPIEPPRPKATNQEAFARRPFTFRPMSPAPALKQKSSFFGKPKDVVPPGTDKIPPSVEVSARLPHPPILTCNKPIPLRLVAKKIVDSQEIVYISSLEINLIGRTRVKSYDLVNMEMSRWVVCSRSGLAIPVGLPGDAVGTESSLPNTIWQMAPLPNTITPSFITCNLQRTYELELKLGLTWGTIPQGGRHRHADMAPQSIFLPLHFSKVEVFSGIEPPAALLEATNARPPRPSPRPTATQNGPPLPARPPVSVTMSAPAVPQQQPVDPLFPPQLGTPQAAIYEQAPPSYDEAMAENMTSTVSDGNRPAYSGETNENAPSLIPGDEGKR